MWGVTHCSCRSHSSLFRNRGFVREVAQLNGQEQEVSAKRSIIGYCNHRLPRHGRRMSSRGKGSVTCEDKIDVVDILAGAQRDKIVRGGTFRLRACHLESPWKR